MIVGIVDIGDLSVDVSDSDSSMPLPQRRSSGMMTSGGSGHGGGGRGGSTGPATGTSPSESDGKSHGVAVDVVLPVVFVVVLVAIGSLLFWWLLRSLRRSTGRGLWAFLMGQEQKPQLVEVRLCRGGIEDGRWDTLRPVAADRVRTSEQARGYRTEHVNKGHASGTATSTGSSVPAKNSGAHQGVMSGRKMDSSRGSALEVRVAVFIAMPSPSRSAQRGKPRASASSSVSMEGEICIGTVHTCF